MKSRFLMLLAVGLFSVGCERIQEPPSVVESVTLAESPAHLAFPSIARLETGEWVCVYRAASSHISDDGVIMGLRSMHPGSRWTDPDTLISGRLDSRDPSVCEISDGTVLMNFFKSRLDSGGRSKTPMGVFVSRSYDGGQTWFTPRMVVLESYDWAACSAKILERKDGVLLLPIYARKGDHRSDVLVVESRDGGESWTRFNLVARDTTDRIDFQEPALAQLADGRIVCMMRTAGADGFLYRSVSGDGGKTWSSPEPTSLQGQAPALLVTESGVLICAYRDFSPHGTSAAISFDGGTTFEMESVLSLSLHDRGYPEMIPADDEDVFCVYYDAPQTGISRIQGTSFTVSPPDNPEGFTVSIQPDSSVALRWNPSPSVHYYQIYRQSTQRDSADTFHLIAETTTSFYRDRPDAAGGCYRYKCIAVRSRSNLIPDSPGASLPVLSKAVCFESSDRGDY